MYIRILKPILDFLFSLVLLIIFSPLIIIISVFIKLESKGPVFFLQERLGKAGRVFKIYKFRTMVDGAIDMGTGIKTTDGDSRITKVGQFLRSSSLDELPQLINILKGEMSLVGPRPPVPYHPYDGIGNYPSEFRSRFDVKPGITGLAQIKLRNAGTWDERIVIDIQYVNRINILLDFSIIRATFSKVLKREGIYN